MTNIIFVHKLYKYLKLWKAVRKMQITDVRLRKVNSEAILEAYDAPDAEEDSESAE